MKYIFSILVLLLGLSFQVNAQSNRNLDESMDKSLTEIESFLDTFNIQAFIDQAFGQNFEKMAPSNEEMNLIQEQMKMGLDQLKSFDVSIFEDFVREMEKSFPDMGDRLFERSVPQKEAPAEKPTKKI